MRKAPAKRLRFRSTIPANLPSTNPATDISISATRSRKSHLPQTQTMCPPTTIRIQKGQDVGLPGGKRTSPCQLQGKPAHPFPSRRKARPFLNGHGLVGTSFASAISLRSGPQRVSLSGQLKRRKRFTIEQEVDERFVAACERYLLIPSRSGLPQTKTPPSRISKFGGAALHRQCSKQRLPYCNSGSTQI